jgi:23S rRNA (cytosine1962-C5)-methyltransferase
VYNVILKRTEEKNVVNGFPWVYANEVMRIDGKDVNGSICNVYSFDMKYIGSGIINHLSKILVRILSYKEFVFDYDFIFNRIQAANDLRVSLGYKNNYRVVFSESDSLSGLIIDKFDKGLVIQISSLGMELKKDLIVEALVNIFNPKFIYERSDIGVRQKEGLEETKGLLYGKLYKCIIRENKVKLLVDVVNGQKTGYFLDQKANRGYLIPFVKDKGVLDLFCNGGSFSLIATKYGAKTVVSVDSSAFALEQLKTNFLLNKLEIPEIYDLDCSKYLTFAKEKGFKYDVIILDPPAYTKSIDTIKDGYGKYLSINTNALKLLNDNGVLFTFSCSEHMRLNMFIDMIKQAANHGKIRIKILQILQQGYDHSFNPNHTSSSYLKGLIVVKES